jgi:iron complex outermembrane receptor protein
MACLLSRLRPWNPGLAPSLLLAAVLIPAASAWAQPGASDPDSVQQLGAIEEIVVTARHREENLQEVPISIAAVSGAVISEARMTTLQELEYSVPNLVFGETGSSGETFIGIRGIGDF